MSPIRNVDYLAEPVPDGTRPADLRAHPMVRALVAELPPTGSVWPIPDRVRWLRAFSAAVSFLRGDPDDDIRIDAQAEWPYVSFTPIAGTVATNPRANAAAEGAGCFVLGSTDCSAQAGVTEGRDALADRGAEGE